MPNKGELNKEKDINGSKISGSDRLVGVYSTNDPLLKWELFRQNTQSIVRASLISRILLSIKGPGQWRSICKDNLNTFKVPHNDVLLRVLSSWQFGLVVDRWIREIYSSLPCCHFLLWATSLFSSSPPEDTYWSDFKLKRLWIWPCCLFTWTNSHPPGLVYPSCMENTHTHTYKKPFCLRLLLH